VSSMAKLLCALLSSTALGCIVDDDCSLNGVCLHSACVCDAPWTRYDCSFLSLVQSPSSPAYPPPSLFNSTTSWGGSVALGEDEKYHMFAAEMANECGLNSWGTNSLVVHAISDSPTGPFERREVVVDAFAHNPTVSRAPDGTWVLYHIGCGTPNKYPKCEKCSDGRTGGCPRAHEQVACTANTTHLMYAESLNGPWIALNATITNPNNNFNIDNPSPVFFPNGTVLLLGRGTTSKNVRTIIAPSWRGPYTLGPLLNLHASVEDPFLYRDARGNFHSLFHEYSAWSGYHAFSRDGLHWSAAEPAFNTTVNYSDGSFVRYGRRERPHLIFHANGSASHLYTSITIGPGDKTATHAQALSAGSPAPTPAPTPAPIPPPSPPPMPTPSGSCACKWQADTGVHGNDIGRASLASEDECCDLCSGTDGCVAVVFVHDSGICHVKRDDTPVSRVGYRACLLNVSLV